jgi:hypothetical protein
VRWDDAEETELSGEDEAELEVVDAVGGEFVASLRRFRAADGSREALRLQLRLPLLLMLLLAALCALGRALAVGGAMVTGKLTRQAA